MYPYQQQVDEVVEAMAKARVLLVNIHNATPNGMHLPMATGMEHALAVLISTSQAVQEKVDKSIVDSAIYNLNKRGYRIISPCDDLRCGECDSCLSLERYQHGEFQQKQ